MIESKNEKSQEGVDIAVWGKVSLFESGSNYLTSVSWVVKNRTKLCCSLGIAKLKMSVLSPRVPLFFLIQYNSARRHFLSTKFEMWLIQFPCF